MAAAKKTRKPEQQPKRTKGENRARTAAFGAVQVASALIERFGWPGGTVLLGWWFVEKYATAEQKVRIVETYVLGTGIGGKWPLAVALGFFSLVLLAQRTVYVRRISTLQKEVDRLAQWKTDHQDARIDGPLHSSEPPRQLDK